jgi:phosphatidate cytidylyltransferase
VIHMHMKKRSTFNVKRLITAVVFIPLFFLYIYYLPPYPYFLGLLLLATVLSMFEFYTMYKVPKTLYIPALAFGGVLIYNICLYPQWIPETLFTGVTILLVLRLFTGSSPSDSMKETGPLTMGLLYIAVFISFLWYLRNGALGREYILLLFASGWLADSSAYYAGTYLGKRKLCPRVSPNKTYEGAFGSVLGGATGAVIITASFNIPDLSLLKAVLIGAVLGLVTIIGDLIESMFKRDAGVKDSSGIIPGHGGLLDKIDGFLMSAPVLYIILRAF